MQDDLILVLKQRREEVNRRISELQSELKILEARADELEKLWKEAVSTRHKILAPNVTIISAPKVATQTTLTIGDLIVSVVSELEEVGYEGADRTAIMKAVRRKAPKAKSNTIRVALGRLIRSKKLQKFGNLYSLIHDGDTITQAASSPEKA
jgi:sugar-specific transcriptional regulator TrmB